MPRVSEALEIILGSVKPLAPREIPVAESLGLVIARDIAAHDSVPPFASSAMDGYAVRGSDVAGASYDSPSRLRVLQDVPAGQVASCRVQPGTAVRIMTGAAVPDGADCVVKVEDTFTDGEFVVIRRGVPGGVNVRPVGEDIFAGTTVFAAGTLIRPAEIGVLASVGCASVPVYPKVSVAVVTTGDELIDVGDKLVPGKIRDANSYTLTAQVRQCGAEPLLIARVADTMDATRSAFARALAQADIVLTNGGVSVGDYDCVKDALESLGARLLFWGIEQKPGKPMAFWDIQGKAVVSLPGYPVSAMICFEEYVRPALRKMMGHVLLNRPWRKAVLQGVYDKRGGGKDRRTHFLRAKAWEQDGLWHAALAGKQGSAVLSSLAGSNALAVVTEEQDAIDAGGLVLLHLTDQPEDH